MKKQNGFTLVEIAIVLVVIGLLLGGVLKGQELLENGRIRKALNDFNTIAAATFTYQDRYRILPGDDDDVATRFGTGTNGDGDGVIGGDTGDNWNNDGGTTEPEVFWEHLRIDGLVDGSGTELPRNAYNGVTGVNYGNFGIRDEHVICMDGVSQKSANIMDTRLDNESNTSGSFQFAEEETLGAAPTDEININTANIGDLTICREL